MTTTIEKKEVLDIHLSGDDLKNFTSAIDKVMEKHIGFNAFQLTDKEADVIKRIQDGCEKK
jgi:hypothetical protein